jgi:hypothetical protein
MAGVPVGLDFVAVLKMGEALGADAELIAEALPDFEAAVLASFNDDLDDIEEEPA